MSPLVFIRGIAGLGMPVVLFVAARARSAARPRAVQTADAGEPLTHLDRRALRVHVADGGNLIGIDLRGARLDQVDLSNRDLSGLDLSRASLRGADLHGAVLDRTNLRGADLTSANLRDVDLDQADLFEAAMWKADLRGADLSGSRNLVMAGIHGSRYDSDTLFPSGFDPKSAGAVLAG